MNFHLVHLSSNNLGIVDIVLTQKFLTNTGSLRGKQPVKVSYTVPISLLVIKQSRVN